MPLIAPQIEKILQETIFPDLEKGRKDFDLPHTKAVVHWMKRLLNSVDGIFDSQVMITAAYAHDWGYIGLFDDVDSTDIEVIHKMKPLHMDRGSQMIAKLIEEKLSKYFSPVQKELTVHLVRMHDRIEELKTEEEVLLMEADTLGMLDTDLVKPTFSKKDNDIFIKRELNGRRLPIFRHNVARDLAHVLGEKRLTFYES